MKVDIDSVRELKDGSRVIRFRFERRKFTVTEEAPSNGNSGLVWIDVE